MPLMTGTGTSAESALTLVLVNSPVGTAIRGGVNRELQPVGHGRHTLLNVVLRHAQQLLQLCFYCISINLVASTDTSRPSTVTSLQLQR